MALKRGPKPKPPEERFWKKVDSSNPFGCWLWTASVDRSGIGQFNKWSNGKTDMVTSSEYSFEFFKGQQVRPGLLVKPNCGNRKCVNPWHLEETTPRSDSMYGLTEGFLQFCIWFMDRDFGCWEWPFGTNGFGYGRFGGKQVHALALEFDGNPNPGSLFALHSCDNPPCFNPAHLRWGTAKDNMADAIERGRARLKEGGKANRKLSEDDVREIRRRIATIPEGSRGGIRSGRDSLRQIAKDYSVPHSVISNIKLGKCYVDVPD